VLHEDTRPKAHRLRVLGDSDLQVRPMLLAERLQSHEATVENEGLGRAHQPGLARLMGLDSYQLRPAHADRSAERERPVSCQVRMTQARAQREQPISCQVRMTQARAQRERPISCQVRNTGAGPPPTAPNARHLCIRTARPDGARPAPA
jgi:hypothetical protein